MGTFLFRHFPCLAFTSQRPIQQQMTLWHIQMEPIARGPRRSSLDNENGKAPKLDADGQTGRSGNEVGVEHALVQEVTPRGSSDPAYRGLQRLLLLMSCNSGQIRLDMPVFKMFPVPHP